MKQYPILLMSMLAFLTLCQLAAPSPTPAPSATPPPTHTSSPIPTDTPEPSSTPEPSPTPIELPDVLSQTFADLSIVHRDSFEYVMPNLAPQGWESEEQFAIWVTQENQLKAQAKENGTVFYFSGEKIIPNSGVYVKFRYTGTAESFTLGLDNVNPNGERILGDNFRSVALEMRNTNLLVYGNQNRNQIKGSFKGDLRLQENTWYDVALGLDKSHNFIIKIWDPNSPQTQLTYLREWPDFPNTYYFISWISAKRSLLLDDFTIFKFDGIFQQ